MLASTSLRIESLENLVSGFSRITIESLQVLNLFLAEPLVPELDCDRDSFVFMDDDGVGFLRLAAVALVI